MFWFCAAAKDFLDPHRNRYSSDHYFLFGLARSDTDGLFTTGQCLRFVNIKNVAERKLGQLDAAPSVSFMKAPPGNDLKECGGARQARINDQWRLTFKRGERGPYDVRIEDPH